MEIVLQKWGNSCGIRIPKALLNELNIEIGDKLEITKSENSININKIEHRHLTIEDMFQEFYKTHEEVPQEKEIDWGEPVGREIW